MLLATSIPITILSGIAAPCYWCDASLPTERTECNTAIGSFPSLGGADYERVVTGGGRASAKLPQFKAINTLLGNLKRP
jgi:hypothetical protein